MKPSSLSILTIAFFCLSSMSALSHVVEFDIENPRHREGCHTELRHPKHFEAVAILWGNQEFPAFQVVKAKADKPIFSELTGKIGYLVKVTLIDKMYSRNYYLVKIDRCGIIVNSKEIK